MFYIAKESFDILASYHLQSKVPQTSYNWMKNKGIIDNLFKHGKYIETSQLKCYLN